MKAVAELLKYTLQLIGVGLVALAVVAIVNPSRFDHELWDQCLRVLVVLFVANLVLLLVALRGQSTR